MAVTQVRRQQIADELTAGDFAAASVDGVAGTASVRTLGTGSQQAAAGDHTHTAFGTLSVTGPLTLDPTDGVIGFADKGGQVVNIEAYGAVGDGHYHTGGSITTGTATLTVSDATFTAADVGKFISVAGAGAAGAPLRTTIGVFTDATHVTVGTNAGTTVAGAVVAYGTDNLTAIRAAEVAVRDAAGVTGGTILVPDRTYVASGRVGLHADGERFLGVSRQKSILLFSIAPASGSDQAAVWITSNHCSVEHLCIKPAHPTDKAAILLSANAFWTFRDVFVFGSTAAYFTHGFHGDGALTGKAEHVFADQTSGHGFQFGFASGQAPNAITLAHCRANNSGGNTAGVAGFYVEDSEGGFVLLNCIAEGNAAIGIHLKGTTNAAIIDCWHETTAASSVRTKFENTTSCRIEGGEWVGGLGSGTDLLLQNADRTLILNFSPGAATSYSIDSSSSGTIFVGGNPTAIAGVDNGPAPASFYGYDAAGAIQAVIQDRGGQVHSITSYGAVAGAADNTVPIQTAYDRAGTGSTTGNQVYWPAGQWNTQKITFYNGVHTRGAGIEATIVKLKGSTATDVFQGYNFYALNQSNSSAGVYNFSFADITIDGNKASSTVPNNQLNGSLTNSATTITVDSTTGFAVSGLILVKTALGLNEVVAYTGTTATTFTGCMRGIEGTVAVAHSDNDLVHARSGVPVAQLNADIASGTAMVGAGTITVSTVPSNFPSTGTLRIDQECFTYTAKAATTFTGVTRATNSTTAANHDGTTAKAQVYAVGFTDPVGGAGIRFVGYGFHLNNVRIRNCRQDGFYSEWGNSLNPLAPDAMDGHIIGVKSHENDGFGFLSRGPHDTLYSSSDAYLNLGSGFRFAESSSSGNKVASCHSYGNTQPWAFDFSDTVLCVNCAGEGAAQGQFYLGASDTVLNGFYAFADSGSSLKGVFLGRTGVSVVGCRIDGKVNNCNGGSIDFTGDGGANRVSAILNQTTGSFFVGTPAATTVVDVQTAGQAPVAVTTQTVFRGVNVRTTADVTTTNTTVTAVTGLAFAVGANEAWEFEVHMKVGTSSNAGTKYAVDIPAGATLAAAVYGTTTANGVFAQEQLTADATLTATAFNTTGALTTAAVGAFVQIRGVVVNGATAGTVQIQHAKMTSGTATVYANAYLTARRSTT